MKTVFDVLLATDLSHEYFEDGIFPEIHIEPNYPTKTILESYGMLFKRTSKGFVLLVELDHTVPGVNALRPLVWPGKLVFKVALQDPFLHNYTQLPLAHKLPQIFYFNNLSDNILGSELLITSSSHVGDQDVVMLSNEIYSLQVPLDKQTVAVSIRDINQQLVWSKRFAIKRDKASDTSGLLSESIDLSSWSPGLLHLYLDEAKHVTLYSDPEAARESIFGIIELYYSSNVPAGYAFSALDGGITRRDYTIKLGRRETIWKYYVVLKNATTDPGFTLDYGAPTSDEAVYPGGVNFIPKTPEATIDELFGSGKVLLFESDKVLPFYEVPKKNIKLNKPIVTTSGTTTEPVIGHLPNASKSIIKPTADLSQVNSEIFVYV